eukprot:1510890-Prymnesium_polylepis.1
MSLAIAERASSRFAAFRAAASCGVSICIDAAARLPTGFWPTNAARAGPCSAVFLGIAAASSAAARWRARSGFLLTCPVTFVRQAS